MAMVYKETGHLPYSSHDQWDKQQTLFDSIIQLYSSIYVEFLLVVLIKIALFRIENNIRYAITSNRLYSRFIVTPLTHWDLVMDTCILVLDHYGNHLSSLQHQAITWMNDRNCQSNAHQHISKKFNFNPEVFIFLFLKTNWSTLYCHIL